MMKRLVCVLCVLLCLLPGAAFASGGGEVIYFYTNICESCTPEEDFQAEYRSLTGQELPSGALRAYNVFHAGNQEIMEETLAAYGLSADDVSLPVVIADGQIYQGATEMYAKLPQDALGATGQESRIYYLYVPACESCKRVEAVLAGLPEALTITRGTYSFESPVVVEKIDVSANPGIAMALFDQYHVPDEKRITPSVFYAGGYLSGADAVEKSLLMQVRAGRAVGAIGLEAEAEPKPAGSWSLAGVALAGLVGGLNPCALSMLLLFLSTLLSAGKRAGRYAAAFLGSKFVCYVLIGTALLGLFQQANPSWLLPVSRIVLTVLGGVMIILNLWDALQARRGEFGKVRNQLPKGLRRVLHSAIGHVNGGKAGHILPAVCLLGALVAGGEFLCAGQVYLMSLLAALQSGADFLRMAGLLLTYCAAFLLPSVVLCVVVVRANALMAASGFLARHMATVKLVTAIAMLAIIIAAWLV